MQSGQAVPRGQKQVRATVAPGFGSASVHVPSSMSLLGAMPTTTGVVVLVWSLWYSSWRFCAMYDRLICTAIAGTAGRRESLLLGAEAAMIISWLAQL